MVKAFVTGGTGFLGGHLARKLRHRGDEAVALVRSPEWAGALAEIGCPRARRELGYSPRGIETGLRDLLSA